MGRRSRSRSPKKHSKKRSPSSESSEHVRKSKKTVTPTKHGVETRSKLFKSFNQMQVLAKTA